MREVNEFKRHTQQGEFSALSLTYVPFDQSEVDFPWAKIAFNALITSVLFTPFQ